MQSKLKNISQDFSASIVVFLVALPLCLGIALACGAPLFSGIISGIVGGIFIGIVSGSQLSVSGPAAGLTVIVANAIVSLGSFENFLLAVFIAGILQIFFGILRAGKIGNFFPSAVIKGMLAAIGIILILKQIPHTVGYDKDEEGDEEFLQHDGHNTFSELFDMFDNFTIGCVVISLISFAILILWNKKYIKNNIVEKIPGPLLVVIFGIIVSQCFQYFDTSVVLLDEHMVKLPVAKNIHEFAGFFSIPDFSNFFNKNVWIVALTIAIIASLETLLCIEATDKLDPERRITPLNRELLAQGIGNSISGLIGGLPMTAVIIRSTANISAGGRTKMSAIFHGILLLLTALSIPHFLNLIPLSALSVILILTGYKLVKISIFKDMYTKGWDSFIPFTVTIVAILLTDLLIGIGIGIFVGMIYIFRTNIKLAIIVTQDNNNFLIKFIKDVTFFNKSFLREQLKNIPEKANVIIDMSRPVFVDDDIAELINEFKINAVVRNINLEIKQDVHHNFNQSLKKIYE